MNEEELKALGLEEKQISSIMKLHKDTIDGSFVPKSRFDEINNETKQLKEDVKNRDDQLEKLKEVNPEKLQEEINTLQVKNQEQTESYTAELNQLKVDQAVERQLNKFNVKNDKAVKALLDLKDVELGEDGSIKGLEEQLNTLKESDDYLFNITTPPKDKRLKGSQPGAQKKTDPNETVDFSKMSYAEIDAHLRSTQS